MFYSSLFLSVRCNNVISNRCGIAFIYHKFRCFVSGQSLTINYQVSKLCSEVCVLDFIRQCSSSTHDGLLLSLSFSEMNLMIVTRIVNDFINVSFDL